MDDMSEVSSLDASYPSRSLSVTVSEDTAQLKKKPTIAKMDAGKRIQTGFDALIKEVLVPSLLKVGANMAHQLVDLLIFQDPSRIGNGGKRDSDGVYVSYSDRFDDRGRRRGRSETILIDHFNSRDDAYSVLRWMKKRIKNHGDISLGQLYDYLGESRAGNSTDFSICWTDLDEASVFGGGHDWTLELPEPN